MSNKLTEKFLVCAILLAGLFVPAAARATTCLRPTPDVTPYYADVIFEATAGVELKVDGGRSRHTRLLVKKVYRGEVPAQVAAAHGGMKGYMPFQRGRSYLIFALLPSKDEAPSGFGPTVFVHLCGATHLLPRQDRFAEGPWIGFDAAKAFGTPRKPGATLVGDRPPGPAPKASPPSPEPSAAPAPTGSDAPQPSPSIDLPVPVAASAPAIVPSAKSAPPMQVAKPSRGCGCSVALPARFRARGWFLLALAAVSVSWRRYTTLSDQS